MNVKWKIALLTLLGFSTAACCSTKKASKDQEPQSVETEGVDTRIMLMYGVPAPDGTFPTPVTEDTPQIKRPVTPFPDGRVAIELTEERATELVEQMAEEEATIINEMNGVPFPDGRVAIVLSEERAAELIKAMEEEEKRRQAEEQSEE